MITHFIHKCHEPLNHLLAEIASVPSLFIMDAGDVGLRRLGDKPRLTAQFTENSTWFDQDSRYQSTGTSFSTQHIPELLSMGRHVHRLLVGGGEHFKMVFVLGNNPYKAGTCQWTVSSRGQESAWFVFSCAITSRRECKSHIQFLGDSIFKFISQRIVIPWFGMYCPFKFSAVWTQIVNTSVVNSKLETKYFVVPWLADHKIFLHSPCTHCFHRSRSTAICNRWNSPSLQRTVNNLTVQRSDCSNTKLGMNCHKIKEHVQFCPTENHKQRTHSRCCYEIPKQKAKSLATSVLQSA